MCLAIPAKILEIKDNKALIESLEVKKEVEISLVPDAKIGDYVIVHAGFAIQMVEKEEALATQDHWKEWLDAQKD
jgi:hydrogenase expression/formation protein HypC